MANTTLELHRRGFAAQLADTVREARALIGWSQRELAARSTTSHTTVWRIERGVAGHLDLAAVERVLTALGIRTALQLDSRHLGDRRRQHDAVHARLTGYIARRLERSGWVTRTEVPIGVGPPRGWIDLLAFREADHALLVDESKTELDDLGAIQRSVAFYEREALTVARLAGWHARSVVVALLLLDSTSVARRLVENRDLARRAFSGDAQQLQAWIDGPGAPRPRGWTVAMVDPAGRRGAWLRPTPLTSGRRSWAYVDYADAAAKLRRRR